MARELERDELHRTIWQIANDLRGSVDGWDFKTYVLGMLFYRFISENLASYINKEEQRTGHKNFNYADISDKDAEFCLLFPGLHLLAKELRKGKPLLRK